MRYIMVIKIDEENTMGCVYKATNTVNGKIYVGKTSYTLNQRIWDDGGHKHKVDGGSKIYFHCAIRKYGFEAFVWEIISESNDLAELRQIEMDQIRLLDSYGPKGYNLTIGGDGGSGYHHTEETKAKISKAGSERSEEIKMKIEETRSRHIKERKEREGITPEIEKELEREYSRAYAIKNKERKKIIRAAWNARNVERRRGYYEAFKLRSTGMDQ